MFKVLQKLHVGLKIKLFFKLNLHIANMTTSNNKEKSIGLIVIGDEILKGDVQDTNTSYCMHNIITLGLKLKKISIIPDELDVIATEVKNFSMSYDHVITSGGIGPTHDDVTFQSVARAFNEETYYHPDLVSVIASFFNRQLVTDPAKLEEDPVFKLAQIPRSGQLHFATDPKTGKQSPYPVVRVANVFILPGVPKLFRKSFRLIREVIRNSDIKYFSENIYINVDESQSTFLLNELVNDESYKGTISFGSYPEFYNSYYKVRISMESLNENILNEAALRLKTIFASSLVNYDPEPIHNAPSRVYQMSETLTPIGTKVKSAIQTIEQALDSYSPDQICLSFNGGKDCTALLHLFYAIIHKRHKQTPSSTNGTMNCSSDGSGPVLNCLYIHCSQPFPEEEDFIRHTITRYSLRLIRLLGKMKPCLHQLNTEHPQIQAILMGTRNTDPHAKHLEPMMMTDSDWPQFMRVSPLLDWTYADVWTFLRSLNVPYCSLYDRGYTSLGDMIHTHPNPKLKYTDKNGIELYHPAYMLKDESLERSGRQ